MQIIFIDRHHKYNHRTKFADLKLFYNYCFILSLSQIRKKEAAERRRINKIRRAARKAANDARKGKRWVNESIVHRYTLFQSLLFKSVGRQFQNDWFLSSDYLIGFDCISKLSSTYLTEAKIRAACEVKTHSFDLAWAPFTYAAKITVLNKRKHGTVFQFQQKKYKK